MRRHGPAAASVALALGLAAFPAAAAPPAVTIAHPWIRFLTPQIPAAGYFILHNDTDHAAVLTGAASQDCGSLMLHESVVQNNTAQMKMVAQVVVPPHGEVAFHPGGYHLMCMSPTAALTPGHSAMVSLRFQDGTSLTAPFPIYGPKGR